MFKEKTKNTQPGKVPFFLWVLTPRVEDIMST